ncbi:MAG: Os1348 family NHLP clan protein [Chloroflexota bacterium]
MSADLQALIGKILSDQDFAEALATDPKKALEEAEIEPTIDLLEALQGVDAESMKQLAASFGDGQAAAG